MSTSRTAATVTLGAAFSLSSSAATAHLVVSGMGPVYDGISHFTLSPDDFLPVLALAFFAGLRGPAHSRVTAGALATAWLAGGTVAFAGLSLPAVALPTATAILYLLIGGLLAANAELSPGASAVVAASLGLVRGAADLMGASSTGPHALSLVGICVSAFVGFALAASVTLPLQKLWMIVAARVSGSWLAALGLLLAGWILRYGAAAVR